MAGRRRALAPLWLGFALVFALLVVLPEASYLASAAAFETLLASLPVSTSTVLVQQDAVGSTRAYAEFGQDVSRRAAEDVGGYMRRAGLRLGSDYFRISSENGKPLEAGELSPVVAFAQHADLQANATLVSGSWSGPTVPADAAKNLGLKTGDQLCVANEIRPDVLCLVIAGVWKQNDPASVQWYSDYTLPFDVEVGGDFGATLLPLGQRQFHAAAVFTPDLAAIRATDPQAVQRVLPNLNPAFGGGAVPGRTVTTRLDETVTAFAARAQLSAFALELVTAQLWVIGIFSLVFLVGVRLESDRETIAVWRTRGWPRSLVARMLSLELLAVAALALIPGGALGVAMAVAVTQAVYPGREIALRWSAAAVAPLIVTGLAVVVATVIAMAVVAARASVVRSRVDVSRPQARWWDRPPIAVVALVLAIPLLVEARLLGDARVRDAGGELPYDIALPGVAMALIAFAGIGLIPPAARAFGRLARGVTARLAAMQLARSSGRQQRVSILVTGAIAIALLAAAHSGTEAQNAADRAAYYAGSDMRVVTGGDKQVNLDTLPVQGATQKSQVFRGYARAGAARNEYQALGVDPYTFARVGWSRPGLMSPDLRTQMKALVAGERGGTVLAEGATSVSIWFFGAHTGGSLIASLTDADLMPVTADFGTLDFDGWKQLTATFAPAQFKPPVRLRHLTLTPVAIAGTVAVSDLTAGGALVDDFASVQRYLPGWWVSDGRSGRNLQDLGADDVYPRQGKPTSRVFLNPGWLPVTLNPPAYETVRNGGYEQVISQRVPVLVSSGLLAANRLKIGSPLSVTVDTSPLNAIVAGTFDYFPTLYGDGLVYSLPAMMAVLGMEGNTRPWPSELWVSGPASSLEADAAALDGNPAVVEVITRAGLLRQAAADPLAPAGRANLLLGFVLAFALAIAAFAIHFAFAARARAAEYAILQANGLSPGQVRASLLAEQLLVIAYSTVLGLVIGAILAVVLLPGLQVSTSVADTMPPTVLALDPALAIGTIGVTVVGCAVAGALAVRPTRSAEVMPELRSMA